MRYRAFISYSHAADGKFAPTLQSCLQRFARPWNRPWAIRVFRDQTDLGLNPNLWGSVEEALGESQFFLLLASPEAAASRWVLREIHYWLDHRDPSTLFIILTSGELDWDEAAGDFAWQTTTALPAQLKGVIRQRPRWLDLRWARSEDHLSLNHGRFRDSVAEIAATLHGKTKAEMESEGVRQARRARRTAAAAISGLTLLALTTALAAYIAVDRANVADQRRIQAEKERDAAISQTLVTRSGKYLPQPLDVGLLYGVEATQLVNSAETRANLLELVQSAPTLEGFLHEIPYVRQLAFSADGTKLATAGTLRIAGLGDGRVALWDLQTRSPLWVRVFETEVVDLAFGLDENTLIAVHADLTVRRMNVVDGSTLSVTRLDKDGSGKIDGWMHDHHLSQGGAQLVATGRRGLQAWDLKSGAVRKIPLPGPAYDDYVSALTLAGKDQATLAIGHALALWMKRIGDLAWVKVQDSPQLGPVVASPVDDVVVFADGLSVRAWDGRTRSRTTLATLKERPTALARTSDGGKVAVGGENGSVAVHFTALPVSSGIVEMHGQDSEVLAMAFSPDGRLLASVSRSGRIALWSVEYESVVVLRDSVLVLRSRLATRLKRLPGKAGLALSAAATLGVSQGPGGTITVSNYESGNEVATIADPSGGARFGQPSVAISPEGAKIGIAGEEGTAVVDTRTGARIGRLPASGGIAFSHDGSRIAIADEALRLWDVAALAPLGDPVSIRYVNPVSGLPEGQQISVRGAALGFSRDGKWLAVGAGPDAYVVDLAARSAKERAVLGLGGQQIVSVALSPDNSLLVAGMRDGTILLWDRTAGVPAGRLRGAHFEPVAALAFDATGMELTSLDEGGAVLRWQMDPRAWTASACRLANRNLFLDERSPLAGGRPSDRTCPITRSFLDLVQQAPRPAR